MLKGSKGSEAGILEWLCCVRLENPLATYVLHKDLMGTPCTKMVENALVRGTQHDCKPQ